MLNTLEEVELKEPAREIVGADAASQQVAKRLETGSHIKESIDYLGQIIDDWGEHLHGVRILKALCTLASADPKRARDGYTALEVAEAVKQAGGPDWYQGDKNQTDAEKAARMVRKHWATAMKIWTERKEGVTQRFADRQLVDVPDYGKEETKGGINNPSRYWLRFDHPEPAAGLSSPERSPLPLDSHRMQLSDSVTPMVRYYTDAVTRSPILERLQDSGFLLNGVRKVIYWSVGISVIALIAALTVILIFALS